MTRKQYWAKNFRLKILDADGEVVRSESQGFIYNLKSQICN